MIACKTSPSNKQRYRISRNTVPAYPPETYPPVIPAPIQLPLVSPPIQDSFVVPPSVPTITTPTGNETPEWAWSPQTLGPHPAQDNPGGDLPTNEEMNPNVDPVVAITESAQTQHFDETEINIIRVHSDSKLTGTINRNISMWSKFRKHNCLHCDKQNDIDNTYFCIKCADVVCWECTQKFDKKTDLFDQKEHYLCRCGFFLKSWDEWYKQAKDQLSGF